ncbi:RnfABCDGE type electron transport complex subunit B [Candidatus Hydrogenedentota bacterium]
MADLLTVISPAVGVVGGLGALLGAGLGLAAKKFAVEVDPRVEAIEEALPSINCGACGMPGCVGFAQAVVSGDAPVNGCIPGGPDVAIHVAEIMGVTAEKGEARIAIVKCRGQRENIVEKFEYFGADDCRAAHVLFGGAKACPAGCIGLHTCAAVCPFSAITTSKVGDIPHVNADRCTGCGKCAKECPRKVIELAPVSKSVHVVCQTHDKGKAVKEVCKVGCIGCGLCAKACPFDAAALVENLAIIDYEKCTSCGLCTAKCPTKCIEGKLKEERAFIKDNCIGCTICTKACPVDAITGERKELHVVDGEKCIGCGVCVDKCPPKVKAIEIRKP